MGHQCAVLHVVLVVRVMCLATKSAVVVYKLEHFDDILSEAAGGTPHIISLPIIGPLSGYIIAKRTENVLPPPAPAVGHFIERSLTALHVTGSPAVVHWRATPHPTTVASCRVQCDTCDTREKAWRVRLHGASPALI